jgi:hypothetical protein
VGDDAAVTDTPDPRADAVATIAGALDTWTRDAAAAAGLDDYAGPLAALTVALGRLDLPPEARSCCDPDALPVPPPELAAALTGLCAALDDLARVLGRLGVLDVDLPGFVLHRAGTDHPAAG